MTDESHRHGRDDLGRARTTLYVSVISDVLDGYGFRDQALPCRIRPLDEETVLVGYARTGLYRDVYHVAEGENPYELEIALIDDLKPDEVPVLACGTSGRIAPWGELLTTAARARKAAGCITDGCVRDVRAIRRMGFPVFHGGIAPLDSRGRGVVAAIDVPVEIAGVPVRSGDLVFGDADGVAVIPRDMIGKVLAAAYEKVAGEDHTRAELEQGRLLREVFEKYGIL